MISIEGLDYSGKSTCAKLISDITGFEYIKIKKGSLFDYSHCDNEQKITKKIINEISEGIKNKSSIVLDRSYLSALITGKIYDPSLDLNSLLQHVPSNLSNPSLGLIIKVPYKIAISRINERMTKQDEIVLKSNFKMHQDILENIGLKQGYITFNNLNQSEKDLRKSLETVLIKHFY